MGTLMNNLDPKTDRKQSGKGIFFYFQWVIVVAFVLATLFTAWTPANLLPESLLANISRTFARKQPDTPETTEWPTATPRPRPRIGIVSGHWGNDSGAVCPDGTKEADVNQDVATRVKESLIGQGYDVDLLKEFDPRLTEYKAMLLVSIHADSCEYINDQATGFKVAAAMSSVYPEKAARLTTCLRTRYSAVTGLPFHPGSITSDMSSYHAFSEINSDTTAAIIETGFLNLDHEILTKHPDIIASGITQGILCFVRNEDIGPQITPTP
jgi:N-acetylmuramoyl-L-alanine amidase